MKRLLTLFFNLPRPASISCNAISCCFITNSCFLTKSRSVCNGFNAMLSCIVVIGRTETPVGALIDPDWPTEPTAVDAFEFRGVISNGVKRT